MKDLIPFLLAQIAEDEAAASAATPGPWHSPPTREYPAGPPITAGFRADADHVARWDPARVLAECEAKRRIVELRYSWSLQAERMSEPPFGPILQTQVNTADAVLRCLALPYNEHSDYREEWRP